MHFEILVEDQSGKKVALNRVEGGRHEYHRYQRRPGIVGITRLEGAVHGA